MNLELFNGISKNAKKAMFISGFINDLQNYLEYDKTKKSNNVKEDIQLPNPTHNGNKIITSFRDKMLIERKNILNNYAKDTLDKGDMYYIYSQNSKMENGYNLCLCKDEYSHLVIEEEKNALPSDAHIGTVLRKSRNGYEIDEEATIKIQEEISLMKDKTLKEQNNYLQSQRIENHIYELSEKADDRAWLFDVTSGSDEGFEEIDFPQELLNDAKEGDLFIYTNNEYKKSSF